MSNTDSFIEEVTEEVRRDKLFRLMRRWGWLAILIVVVLVGGAAWNEWRKAQERATSQAFGDAVIAASQSETAQVALQDLPAVDADQQLLKSLLIAGAAANGGDRAQTAATLQNLADSGDLPPLYRQLALLKAQMSGGTGDAIRDARILDELATPGGAFRPLAMEQQALRLAGSGDSEGAIALMRDITVEAGVTDTLRRRALQVIVALGGDIDPA